MEIKTKFSRGDQVYPIAYDERRREYYIVGPRTIYALQVSDSEVGIQVQYFITDPMAVRWTDNDLFPSREAAEEELERRRDK